MSQAIERERAFVDTLAGSGINNAWAGCDAVSIGNLRELLAGYIDPQHVPAIRRALIHTLESLGHEGCELCTPLRAALEALPKGSG